MADRLRVHASVFMPVVALAVGVGLSTACSASDPGFIDYSNPRNEIADAPRTTSGNDSGSQSASNNDGGTGGTGGTGTAGASTGGSPAIPPEVLAGTAFEGTPAYKAALPSQNAKAAHDASGGKGPANPGAKDACMTCHDQGGGGVGAPPFLFAGTVYKDRAGQQPAGNVEIRVLGSDKSAILVNSDAEGNFWQLANAAGGPAAFPPTAKSAARFENKLQAMVSVTTPNCNQAGCHAAGGVQPVIFVE